jgi:hypothetical protein
VVPEIQVRSLDRHDEAVVGHGGVAQGHDLRVFVCGRRLERHPSRLGAVASRDAAPDLIDQGVLAAGRFPEHACQQQVVRINAIDRLQIQRSLRVCQLVLLLEDLVNCCHFAAPSKRALR